MMMTMILMVMLLLMKARWCVGRDGGTCYKCGVDGRATAIGGVAYIIVVVVVEIVVG